jgi:hypothetical protein
MREEDPLAAAPATERSERVGEEAEESQWKNTHLRTDAGYRADQACVRVCVRFIRTKKRT